jgi:hypothetical protein
VRVNRTVKEEVILSDALSESGHLDVLIVLSGNGTNSAINLFLAYVPPALFSAKVSANEVASATTWSRGKARPSV